jgi:hypothetical protein
MHDAIVATSHHILVLVSELGRVSLRGDLRGRTAYAEGGTLMRIATLCLALAVGLDAAETASAGFFGPPQPVSYQVVTSTNANTPISTPLQLSSSTTNPTLASFFPTFRAVNNTNVIGTSNFPTNSQLPSGSYLQAFGYSRPGNFFTRMFGF